MKIGFIQQHNLVSIADNMSRIAEKIIDLSQQGAKLIVLQELHNTIYLSGRKR